MSDHDNHSDDLTLPHALIRDLSELYRAETRVPAEIDREIHTRARMSVTLRRRTRLLRIGGFAAAAAVVGVVLWFAIPASSPTYQATKVTPASAVVEVVTTPEDINADHRVDVRDALQLARQIEAKATLDAKFDLNHDGVIDRRDADTIAMSAVRLDEGGVVR